MSPVYNLTVEPLLWPGPLQHGLCAGLPPPYQDPHLAASRPVTTPNKACLSPAATSLVFGSLTGRQRESAGALGRGEARPDLYFQNRF